MADTPLLERKVCMALTPEFADGLHEMGASGACLLVSLLNQIGVGVWRSFDPFLGVNCVNLSAS